MRHAGCSVSEEYGSSGVPHVFIVNQKGKIVFKGHPANRKDLAADLKLLAQDENATLTGTGCEEESAATGTGADSGAPGDDS